MNCNTNPTSGCSDVSLIVEISKQTEELKPLLIAINEKLEDIYEQSVACCEETNNNLESIDTKLGDIYSLLQNCCEDINLKLSIVAEIMGDCCGDSSTTEEPIFPTTEEYVSTTTGEYVSTTTDEYISTTSEEPVATTTEEPDGCFDCYLYDVICLEEFSSTTFDVVLCNGDAYVWSVPYETPYLDRCLRYEPVYVSGSIQYSVTKKTVCGEFCPTTTEEPELTTTTSSACDLYEVVLGIGDTELEACTVEASVYYIDTPVFGIGSYVYSDCEEVPTPINALFVVYQPSGTGYHCVINHITGTTGNTCG